MIFALAIFLSSARIPASTPARIYEGEVVVSTLEGRHLELQTSDGTWVLLPANEKVRAELEEAAGGRARLRATVFTGATIYLKRALEVRKVEIVLPRAKTHSSPALDFCFQSRYTLDYG